MEKVTYSPAEVAELLGVTRPFLYPFLRSGELKSCKIGHLRRIRREHLEEFLDGREGWA